MTLDQREALGFIHQRPGCTQADLRRATGWTVNKSHRVVSWLLFWGYARSLPANEVHCAPLGAKCLFPKESK